MLKKWLAIAFFGASLIGFLIFRLLQGLVYGAIGMIFANICNAELDYSALVRLSIISITPVVIADMAFSLLSIDIPYWHWIGVAITVLYLFFGVKVNATVSEEDEELETEPSV